MSDPPRDLFTLWDVVQRKFQICLRATPYPGSSFDSVPWPDLPLELAERGLFLQGLPSICKPDVRKDVVEDDLISWPKDRLLALEKSIDEGSLAVLKRDPLSRRVIFEITESNGTSYDSTLGFSDQWIIDHMFPERLYEQLTVPVLKTMNVDSLMAILEKAKISHTGVPWIVLPSKLWSSGQFLSGMPRNCLPKVTGDKVETDDPSPATKWRKDQRVSFQRSADSGLLKVLPRPPDRDVIFEVLEPDGLLRDDDCGLSNAWKLKFAPPELKNKAHQRNMSLPGSSNMIQPVPPFLWKVSPVVPQSGALSKKAIVAERYSALLRIHGLLLDSPEGPAWVYVPQMLATKRSYILGLPRECLPIVRDDDVIANYDPRQWTTAAQDSFLQAADAAKVLVVGNGNRIRVLYRVIESSGTTTDETIGFSEKWLQENLDPVDLADPTVSASIFVKELWLCMLESVNVPCHDHRGRRRIPWLQLPILLAHRRLYIVGCPKECHPKVEDDIVAEMSSPYFWDDQQIRLMGEAFVKNRVSVCNRQPGRNVLFTYEAGENTHDSTCGFSATWMQMNLHFVPNTISTPIPLNSQPPFVPATSRPSPQANSSSTPQRPQKVTVKRYAKRPRDPIAVLASSTAGSASNVTSPTTAQAPGNNQNNSLKIIIPAYKRRSLGAQKETQVNGRETPRANANLNGAGQNIVSAPVARPKRSEQPIPAIPRHLLPARRSSQRINHSSTPLPPPMTIDSSATSDDEKPGGWGLRASMSPPLPPSNTLPDPLPTVAVPAFLPIPGGGLTWDHTKSVWELTISEAWPPEEWKKKLPVFPARVLWNAVQQVWMCEPASSLTKPRIRLSPAVQAAFESSTIDGPLNLLEPGLSIIWHRWRRTWGLFEYVSPIPA